MLVLCYILVYSMQGMTEVFGEQAVLGYRDAIAGDYWKVDFRHGFQKDKISFGLNKPEQAVLATKCVKMKDEEGE